MKSLKPPPSLAVNSNHSRYQLSIPVTDNDNQVRNNKRKRERRRIFPSKGDQKELLHLDLAKKI